MTERVIDDTEKVRLLLTYLGGLPLPFTIKVTKGKHRTVEQNKLQRMWCNEIAEQLGDRTAGEVRGYCKLTIGVPLLRAENEKFRQEYDRVVKPLPYETKLALMQEPLDFPITRLMTTAQKSEYLDRIFMYWGEKGVELTIPEDVSFKEDLHERHGTEQKGDGTGEPDHLHSGGREHRDADVGHRHGARETHKKSVPQHKASTARR